MQTLSASFLLTNLVTLVPKPGKEAGSPLPSCPHRRDRHLRMSSSRSRDSTRNAAGHEDGPGKTFLCPRPEPAAPDQAGGYQIPVSITAGYLLGFGGFGMQPNLDPSKPNSAQGIG